MRKCIADAMWINADEKISSPYLRTMFDAQKDIESAVLHCTGLGYFEAYINGKKVGDDVLIPAQTDYDDRNFDNLLYPINLSNSHRIMYLSYDVSDMIGNGGNALGIWLGNGFYRQNERSDEGNLSFGIPKAIACLQIKYLNGTMHTIMTDNKNWYYHESPIIFNNIYYGEIYDAMREIADWCMPGSSAEGWEKVKQARIPSGRLVPQDCPADRCQEAYSPKLIHQEGEKKLYDVGKNISGWVHIKVSGQKGQEVKIRFADDIDDKYNLDFESCGGIRQIQQLKYILNSQNIQSYHPRFCWMAFRYFEIETSAKILDSVVEFVGTNISQTGEFKCSNELLNTLYNLYINTQRTNIHGCVSSDCPHRERLGYTGDGQLVAEPILLNFDGYAFIRKWITDIKEGQDRERGFVPHTIPFMGGGGGPAWGSAVIIVPWKYYLQTGDIEVLREMLPAMEMWINYLNTRTQGDYIIHFEEEGGWCLGDWCTPGEVVIPEKYVNTCLYAYLSLLMDDICTALGIETTKYITLHETIKKAIITEWFNVEENTFSIGSQGANAMALWAKVVPEDKISEVAKKMAAHIDNDCAGHLDTGIFGTPILLDMLTEYGYTDIAYGIMNKKTYPSFGYMLENGATTLWERFEKRDSDNHPMFGTYTSWFVRALAGINTDKHAPGYRKVVIKPVVPCDLEHVFSEIKTMTGETIKSEWKKIGDTILEISISIPKDSSLEFILPGNYRLLSRETIGNDTFIRAERDNF